MKMVMAVVPANSAERVLDALVNTGHTATYAQTRGGMLRQSQFSLFIAVKKEQLDEVLRVIKENCRTQVQMSTRAQEESSFPEKEPVNTELGGAVTFIWEIEQIEIF
ncbi:MAG: cyclic-di-AMP receptor [Anaerolineales bacterium]|jgi:uncharacterized protein YaaQ